MTEPTKSRAEYQAQRRAHLVALGRCVCCLKNTPDPGFKTCRPCIDKEKDKAKGRVTLKISYPLALKAMELYPARRLELAVDAALRDLLK